LGVDFPAGFRSVEFGVLGARESGMAHVKEEPNFSPHFPVSVSSDALTDESACGWLNMIEKHVLLTLQRHFQRG
jgi:hypothetical protein